MDAEWQAWVKQAEDLARAGNFTVQALACNQEILKRDPKNIPALQRLVTIYANSKQWRQVHDTCQDILRLDPQNRFAKKRLADLLKGRAKTIFTGQALSSLPLAQQLEHTEDPEQLHRLGKKWQEAGSAPEAVRAFQKALERDPSRVYTRLALAGTWRDLQCFAASEEVYESLLAHSRDPAVRIAASVGLAAVLADRARVHQQPDLRNQAQSLCLAVLRFSPGHQEALNTLRRIRKEMEED